MRHIFLSFFFSKNEIWEDKVMGGSSRPDIFLSFAQQRRRRESIKNKSTWVKFRTFFFCFSNRPRLFPICYWIAALKPPLSREIIIGTFFFSETDSHSTMNNWRITKPYVLGDVITKKEGESSRAFTTRGKHLEASPPPPITNYERKKKRGRRRRTCSRQRCYCR